MDELDYEAYLERYNALFGTNASSHPDNILYAQQSAQYDHALSVFNPLRDWYIKTIRIAAKLADKNAQCYMKYGAGRRLGMMFYAYRKIISIADPKRKDALTSDEQQELSKDINVIYMHTRGVLDNFAWCFLFEKHEKEANSINPMAVTLFSSEFRKACPTISPFLAEIDKHKDWIKDLKERRDPVAHRIPLYIPSSQIGPGEVETVARLNERHFEAVAKLDFDEADAAFAQMYAVGQFIPCFVHHPAKEAIPIYPTVPTDMAHIIKIGNVIERALLNDS